MSVHENHNKNFNSIKDDKCLQLNVVLALQCRFNYVHILPEEITWFSAGYEGNTREADKSRKTLKYRCLNH